MIRGFAIYSLDMVVLGSTLARNSFVFIFVFVLCAQAEAQALLFIQVRIQA